MPTSATPEESLPWISLHRSRWGALPQVVVGRSAPEDAPVHIGVREADGEALDALMPDRSIPLGLPEPPDMWLDLADGAVVLRLTAWVEPATASAHEVESSNGVYVALALNGAASSPCPGTAGTCRP